MSLRIDILTLFPEMFPAVLEASIVGRARQAGAVDVHLHNIRDYAGNKHNKVDDRPFGGGPGMVLMCQPLYDAVMDVEAQDERTALRILLSPQGEPLRQPRVESLAAPETGRLLLIAGHYEGIDERVIEAIAPFEISLGDYVLSGGELAAMVLIDAIARLQPGVLGHADSAAEDSFSPRGEGQRRLLDCPHYTRPQVWTGREVPPILVSGDHGAVARWREEQMMERTRARRPDLLSPQPDLASETAPNPSHQGRSERPSQP
ncbi:MAG: tRNA (guanosine(37)-N1)-methyltransferase TrmD [Phycisphaerales bacterium]|nr:MAG: tRNA (guanosine(37)-N1)-methyltransferase TrmD [Phycisphaerales bacterium]